MEKRLLFILLGLFSAAVFADAYTWTDENGVIHYSDRPVPGAKVIVLEGSVAAPPPQPTARRVATPTARSSPTAEDDSSDVEQQFTYASLEIASPGAEETLWNIGGTHRVALTLSPALRDGDQVRLYFDGTPQIVAGTSFELQEVYRGVHNLQAEVIDASGQLMIRSQPSRFYVQQNTVN